MGKSRKRISKRFALVLYAVLAITAISIIAIFKDMETVAFVGATAIAAVIYQYTNKETERASK